MKRLLGICLAAALTATSPVLARPAAAAPAAPVATPTLSSPPAGNMGFPLWDSWYDLAPFGYEEQEYFVSGTASDGGTATAPYVTRIIVTRPSDAADFNGTVLLDWVNVTAQFEIAVDTLEAREMLMREGFAYVHVSAQAAGLDGIPLLTPKQWDPVRYADIDHPGDQYSFDMLSQIAQAFRSPPGAGSLDPMGALGVASIDNVLVAGQSQSALRLRDYLDDWLPGHPEAVPLIDGYLVHGDVFAAKPFDNPLPVKVLHLLSDLEALDDGFDPATADPNYRLWEIAGTAHADLFVGHQSIAGYGQRVLGLPKQNKAQYDSVILTAGNYGEVLNPELAVCIAAGATMPMHYAASTAIHQLAEWVRGNKPPRSGPRFAFSGGALAKDQHGNTKGGIRLPPIDVPVARYVSTLCQLGGITVQFTDVELLLLYGTHAEYYAQMAARTDQAVADGWLLPPDAIDLMKRACAAQIRFPLSGGECAAYTPPAFDSPLPAAAAPADPVATAPSAPEPAANSRGSMPATGTAIPMLPVALALIGWLVLRRHAQG